MGARRRLKTAVRTEVNKTILEVARGSISPEPTWEFLCECGHLDCAAQVRLSLDEYVRLRNAGDAVLALGHRLSRAERARRLAQELREESEALRAQAEQQVRRSKKRTA